MRTRSAGSARSPTSPVSCRLRPPRRRPVEGNRSGAVVARIFGLDAAPDPTARPDDIPGWDSLGTLELVIALETTFATKIDERRLADVRTVGDLEQLLG